MLKCGRSAAVTGLTEKVIAGDGAVRNRAVSPFRVALARRLRDRPDSPAGPAVVKGFAKGFAHQRLIPPRQWRGEGTDTTLWPLCGPVKVRSIAGPWSAMVDELRDRVHHDERRERLAVSA
jgi:hypothetical protein